MLRLKAVGISSPMDEVMLNGDRLAAGSRLPAPQELAVLAASGSTFVGACQAATSLQLMTASISIRNISNIPAHIILKFQQ